MADWSCYGCEKAEENPLVGFRGPADCVSCNARVLAAAYGGMTREQIDPVLLMTWPDTKTFTKGRALFWSWVKKLEEAKDQT